ARRLELVRRVLDLRKGCEAADVLLGRDRGERLAGRLRGEAQVVDVARLAQPREVAAGGLVAGEEVLRGGLGLVLEETDGLFVRVRVGRERRRGRHGWRWLGRFRRRRARGGEEREYQSGVSEGHQNACLKAFRWQRTRALKSIRS